MNTVARPTIDQRAHWYDPKDGSPMHTVIAKGNGEPRPTTLRDAKELGLVPSVTNILKVLAKPQLQSWITEQACLAVLTTPKLEAETLDEFVFRVMHTDKVQEQERDKAADLGKRIHGSLTGALSNRANDSRLDCFDYIAPLLDFLSDRQIIATEESVVGKGYAGTIDLITDAQPTSFEDIWDFKTTKRLPEKEKSYPEHRLQLAAYAEARERDLDVTVRKTYNVYISTTEPGKFVIHANPCWMTDYERGFRPILEHWQWANGMTNSVDKT